MTYILPITEVRKNIFTLADRVARTGEAIEVEKEGKRIVKIVPVKDDTTGKADYILTHVLPKLKGAWSHGLQKDVSQTDAWVRGKKETQYWKRPVFS